MKMLLLVEREKKEKKGGKRGAQKGINRLINRRLLLLLLAKTFGILVATADKKENTSRKRDRATLRMKKQQDFSLLISKILKIRLCSYKWVLEVI